MTSSQTKLQNKNIYELLFWRLTRLYNQLWHIIGSGNGLSFVWRLIITWINGDLIALFQISQNTNILSWEYGYEDAVYKMSAIF